MRVANAYQVLTLARFKAAGVHGGPEDGQEHQEEREVALHRERTSELL